ncbi:MAG: hypothetical protein HOE90_20105 [Bacteriovoracaceae bacterium]|jgi:hypothetical protein|nr:hypothetical protein [Bacteriovoracaceae bacterium]
MNKFSLVTLVAFLLVTSFITNGYSSESGSDRSVALSLTGIAMLEEREVSRINIYHEHFKDYFEKVNKGGTFNSIEEFYIQRKFSEVLADKDASGDLSEEEIQAAVEESKSIRAAALAGDDEGDLMFSFDSEDSEQSGEPRPHDLYKEELKKRIAENDPVLSRTMARAGRVVNASILADYKEELKKVNSPEAYMEVHRKFIADLKKADITLSTKLLDDLNFFRYTNAYVKFYLPNSNEPPLKGMKLPHPFEYAKEIADGDFLSTSEAKLVSALSLSNPKTCLRWDDGFPPRIYRDKENGCGAICAGAVKCKSFFGKYESKIVSCNPRICKDKNISLVDMAKECAEMVGYEPPAKAEKNFDADPWTIFERGPYVFKNKDYRGNTCVGICVAVSNAESIGRDFSGGEVSNRVSKITTCHPKSCAKGAKACWDDPDYSSKDIKSWSDKKSSEADSGGSVSE